MNGHVAVLMGGWSKEREVSLVSGAAVATALKDTGFQVTEIDVHQDAAALLSQLYPIPDKVFNALHGRFGEDGCVQGFLNILGVPYTHSGVLASALAMDKPMSKRVFKEVGITVADHQILTREQLSQTVFGSKPHVIKPLNEGSSVGVNIIFEGDSYTPTEKEWPFGSHVMAEQYISGRELTVAVMGERALGVTEIKTGHLFYDYDAKYSDGGSIHQVPAQLPQDIYDEAMRISVLAHKTLGCRGISRADMRYDGKDLYLLEVNTQPGMTPTSLVPEQASYANISFENLVVWLVEHAECDG
ncbi:MAG: D-alanine--D-alanine ligase B [Alphaproteobacteria bacterium MarineAlpha3_Bin6]|nr:MAG: D-alanine--D-alanine ligase B [Alphaproteobacteria bacterium MarineAlpha3_Bin6]HHZ76158.1 D-alanine--D-alanine ligase [Rhodospirillales bacterium]HIN75849.1 D-alanine--D-alanine ligase [Rhodospirillales bacterium]